MKKTIAAVLLTVIYAAPPAKAQTATPSPFDGTKLRPMTVRYEARISAVDSSQEDRTIAATLKLEKSEADGRPTWKLDISGPGHEVDVWDRTTLEAVTRTSTFGGKTRFLGHRSDAVHVIVDGEEQETYKTEPGQSVVSDGMLNYFALGTMPLEIGYKSSYNSLVSRRKAILTHRLAVVGDTTIVVPAGRFETYVVTERIVDPNKAGGNATTWYVMKKAPRLVARLESVLDTGANVRAELSVISH